MLTPHVIRTPERFQEMTEELKDSLRNVRKFVDEHRRDVLITQEEARRQRIKELERETQKPELPKPEPKPEPPKPEGRN
jgi:hypothetical protein